MAAALAGRAREVPQADVSGVQDALAVVESDDTLASLIAFLFGDEAAEQCGWTGVGLGADAGLAFASSRAASLPDLEAALRSGWTPDSA